MKIEGCDYRVSKEMILEWLGQYGELLTDLVEDVFEDSEDSEGTNTTGIYSVKMKLNYNIPQLLPVDGRRIKIYYRNIIKLCTSCFGKHARRNCKEPKVKWIDYVRNFILENPMMNPNLFGKWITILEREKGQHNFVGPSSLAEESGRRVECLENEMAPKQTEGLHPDESANQLQPDEPANQQTVESEETEAAHPTQGDVPKEEESKREPKPEDFNLPQKKEEWDDLVEKMVALGMSHKDANANIEKQKKQFNQAQRDYTNSLKQSNKKGRPSKSRKNSLNDI